MKEAKLILFPSSLEYRFCNPGWREIKIRQSNRIVSRCQRIIQLKCPIHTQVAAVCIFDPEPGVFEEIEKRCGLRLPQTQQKSGQVML